MCVSEYRKRGIELNDRLERQMKFIAEIDKLKMIFRQSLVSDGTRRENDAEHSWHTALMCILLGEYAPENTDVFKSAELMLIHDLVEIYAGDTYLYDVVGNETQAERERASAEKLYSILPDDQCERFKSLWEEFETKETNEAKFAGIMDRLQPIMLNYLTKGERWQYHKVTKDIVFKNITKSLENAHPDIYDFAMRILNESVEKGYLPESYPKEV